MKWHYFTWILLLYCNLTSSEYSSNTNELKIVSRRIRDISNGTKTVADSSTNIKAVDNTSTRNEKIQTAIPHGVFVINPRPPDKNYNNASSTFPKKDDDYQTEGEGDNSNDQGQPKFDENAIERSLIVVAGLAFILLIYFGVKFMYLKKRKANKNKRYGRIDSEIDLLDEIDDEESDEEEELFDISTTRRSQQF